MKNRNFRRNRFSSSERQEILAAFNQSGLTQREFARQNNISLSALSIWLRKSRKTPSKPSFIAAPNLFSLGASGHFRLELPSGLSLEIRTGFQPEELRCLLTLLQTA